MFGKLIEKLKLLYSQKKVLFLQNRILIRILIIISLTFFIFVSLEIFGYFLAIRHKIPWEERMKIKPLDHAYIGKLERNNSLLKKRIDKLAPRGIFLMIDTAQNLLYIKKGNETIRTCIVSCGSGNILEDPNGNRHWVFDTPRGEFIIISKIKDPLWVKPDWAFIEEGEGIPQKNKDRLEEGMMGDYALGFGNGFFIHGTLYTRMLGRNVTHGCIRVGDDDLKFLYKIVSIGSKIYIY